jgi:hypothetical protein
MSKNQSVFISANVSPRCGSGLEAHKITPVNFRMSGGYSSIGLDIAFSSPEDANRFEREFGERA